nr:MULTISPECIES: three component ABC system middle component [unclassified Clostridium]
MIGRKDIKVKLNSLYNNEIVGIKAISTYLDKKNELEFEKYILLYPLLLNDSLINNLKNRKRTYKSLDEIAIKEINNLYNFSEKFYDSLNINFNIMQFLIDLGWIELNGGKVKYINRDNNIEFSSDKRIKSIISALPRLNLIFNENIDKIYYELRVRI